MPLQGFVDKGWRLTCRGNLALVLGLSYPTAMLPSHSYYSASQENFSFMLG